MTERRYRWFVAMGLGRRRRRATREEAVNQLAQAEQLYRPTFLPECATHRGDEGPDPDPAGQAVRGR